MKYIIASDIHGSLFFAQKIIDAFINEKANKLILLGDLYYHGPRNPLPKDYNPMKVSELLNQYKKNIIAIRGNCDSEVDQTISQFRYYRHLTIIHNGKKFYFTHGHKHNQKKPPKANFDVLVYGHEHVSYIYKEGEKTFANPGSASIPKNNSSHSYIVLDKELKIVDIVL